MIDALIKWEKFVHREKMPCEDEDSYLQAKERDKEQMLPPQPSEGTTSDDTLILD